MTYLAFVRGINVGGNRKLPMADLRVFLTELGFDNPRTLLQSGNAVFDAKGHTTGEMEKLLEKEAEIRLKVKTDFMVRTLDELAKVIESNPFEDEAKSDPSHLLVLFLKVAPEKARIEKIKEAMEGPETAHFEGRHVYIVYPNGIGTSKLGKVLNDKALGTSSTGRNWNTVLKMAELARHEP